MQNVHDCIHCNNQRRELPFSNDAFAERTPIAHPMKCKQTVATNVYRPARIKMLLANHLQTAACRRARRRLTVDWRWTDERGTKRSMDNVNETLSRIDC